MRYDLNVKTTISVEVGERGRMVIPASVREQLGIHAGSKVHLRVENGALIVMTPEAAERELWAMFEGVGVSLADELIADRRAELEVENPR